MTSMRCERSTAVASALSPAQRQRVAECKDAVRAMAYKIAPRGDRVDAEELFQAGMDKLCELALELGELSREAFEQRTFRAVRYHMLDHCRMEAKLRTRSLAITRATAEISTIVSAGYLFDTEEARRDVKKKAVNAIMAAAAICMMATQPAATPEDTVALDQMRERVQAVVLPLVPRMDPIDWALVRDTAIEGKKLAESARQLGIEERQARYRYEKTMSWLGEEMRKAGLGG
jgi:RNA polymerase sigma factor (sigma-70 family)